jgi:hypothetical protein
MSVAAQILQYLSALYASVWFESMMIFLPLCGEQTERRVEAAVKYTVHVLLRETSVYSEAGENRSLRPSSSHRMQIRSSSSCAK